MYYGFAQILYRLFDSVFTFFSDTNFSDMHNSYYVGIVIALGIIIALKKWIFT